MDEQTARRLLGADPTSWLLGSVEPYTRWVTLTRVLGRPDPDEDVRIAHDADGHGEEVVLVQLHELVERLQPPLARLLDEGPVAGILG